METTDDCAVPEEVEQGMPVVMETQ